MVLSALERGSDTEGRWLDIQTTYRRLGGPDSGATSTRKMGRRMTRVIKALMKRRMIDIAAKNQKRRTKAAKVANIKPKSGVKQVDRLLSNAGSGMHVATIKRPSKRLAINCDNLVLKVARKP